MILPPILDARPEKVLKSVAGALCHDEHPIAHAAST